MKRRFLIFSCLLAICFSWLSCSSFHFKTESKNGAASRQLANYSFSRSHCLRDSQGQLPVHHIYFIHGLGGGLETFGFYPDNIETVLNVSTCFEAKSHLFLYETGGVHGKSVFEFARDFDKFVRETSPIMGPQDQISIVGHSQGGVIGMIWLYKAYRGFDGHSFEHGKSIRNFVTLGTPYWGSRLAYFAFNPFGAAARLLDRFDLHPQDLLRRMKASPEEARSLNPENGQYFLFQSKMLEEKPGTGRLWIEELQKNIRFYSIGGAMDTKSHDVHPDQSVSQSYISLAKLVQWFYPIGKTVLESDLAVSLPSSRLGFIAFKDPRTTYPVGDYLRADRFKQAHALRNTHYIVEAPHVDLQPIFDRAERILDMEPRGMAFMPKKCDIAEIQNCLSPKYRNYDELGAVENSTYHPTFFMVSAFLAENKVAIQNLAQEPKLKAMAAQAGLFMIDFYIRVPKTSKLQKEDLILNFEKRLFKQKDNAMELSAEFRDNRKYFYQLGSFEVAMTAGLERALGKLNSKIFRLSLYGYSYHAFNDLDDKGPVFSKTPIKFEISAKNHRPRTVEIEVSPTYTTIVDLALQPEETASKVQ